MSVLKTLLPIVVIGICLLIAKIIVDNPPAAKSRASTPNPAVTVDTITVVPEDYQIIIESYGTVQPARVTTLIPQVAGKITTVSDNFNNGGFVKQNEIVLQLDQADYQIAVKTAAASLARTKATLSEQAALSQQAIKDWKRLGRSGEPSDLVARKPQLDAAKAEVASAEAQLEKAQLDLQRTSIRAPFDGRIRSKQADLGQYVSPGSTLAELFSSEVVELRLPLSIEEFAHLQLPARAEDKGSEISFSSNNTRVAGYLSRSEGALDEKTRQLFVIGRIDVIAQNNAPITVGQFLQAELKGQVIKDSFVVPNELVNTNSEVLIANNGRVKRQAVEVAWRDKTHTVISSGLKTGDQIISTPLGEKTENLKIKTAASGDTLQKPDTALKPDANTRLERTQ